MTLEEANKDMLAFEAFMKQASEELAVKAAHLYKDRLTENIRTNKYGFSLKESTVARRVNKTSTPLIDTGEYINNIVIKGKEVTVTDGVHKGSGISFEELSAILEYGRVDKSIPPFPVWAKTYEEIQPEIRKLIDKKVSEFYK